MMVINVFTVEGGLESTRQERTASITEPFIELIILSCTLGTSEMI